MAYDYGDKACAWIANNYEEFDHNDVLRNKRIGETPNERAERIATRWVTINGKQHKAISLITEPNKDGNCPNMNPYYRALGSVFLKK